MEEARNLKPCPTPWCPRDETPYLWQGPTDDDIWQTLWVSWYKSRGRTEAMWLLSDNSPPRRPTEVEAVMIANAIAMEAAKPDRPRSGLDPEGDSAGPKDIAQTTGPSTPGSNP